MCRQVRNLEPSRRLPEGECTECAVKPVWLPGSLWFIVNHSRSVLRSHCALAVRVGGPVGSSAA